VAGKTPDTASLPPEYQRITDDRDGDVNNGTTLLINSGLGLNLAERLFVDMWYQSESFVYLTNFGYVSLRFIF
jgi:hypothetical protein